MGGTTVEKQVRDVHKLCQRNTGDGGRDVTNPNKGGKCARKMQKAAEGGV